MSNTNGWNLASPVSRTKATTISHCAVHSCSTSVVVPRLIVVYHEGVWKSLVRLKPVGSEGRVVSVEAIFTVQVLADRFHLALVRSVWRMQTGSGGITWPRQARRTVVGVAHRVTPIKHVLLLIHSCGGSATVGQPAWLANKPEDRQENRDEGGGSCVRVTAIETVPSVENRMPGRGFEADVCSYVTLGETRCDKRLQFRSQ